METRKKAPFTGRWSVGLERGKSGRNGKRQTCKGSDSILAFDVYPSPDCGHANASHPTYSRHHFQSFVWFLFGFCRPAAIALVDEERRA